MRRRGDGIAALGEEGGRKKEKGGNQTKIKMG